MKKLIKIIFRSFKRILANQIKIWRFKKEYREFIALTNKSEFSHRLEINWNNRYPCLNDNTGNTEFDRHYIYHPAWAARILANIKPRKHIDIGSSLSFCTMLSAFIPVAFYDYRPAELSLSGLSSEHANLTSLLFKDNSIDSLSCMHVIEHIGLGRFGDTIDSEGDLKAISELKRVLAHGGNLLFVTPVGKAMIRFNAHRIYSYTQIIEYFSPLILKQFALIDDDGHFVRDAEINYVNQQSYGCGCWWFYKE